MSLSGYKYFFYNLLMYMSSLCNGYVKGASINICNTKQIYIFMPNLRLCYGYVKRAFLN